MLPKSMLCLILYWDVQSPSRAVGVIHSGQLLRSHTKRGKGVDQRAGRSGLQVVSGGVLAMYLVCICKAWDAELSSFENY